MTTAELSNLLYIPTTLLLYVGSMGFYAWAMANAIERPDVTLSGRVARHIGLTLGSLGLLAHLGHLITRAIAAGGRVPWGNMFEYSSVLGFIVAFAAIVVFHLRLKRPELTTFLLLGAVLWLGLALVTFSEPDRIQPVLNSSWLWIHVTAVMISFAIFTLSFVTNGMYLVRERAETNLAARPRARSLGAAVNEAVATDVDAEHPVVDFVGDSGDGPDGFDAEARRLANDELRDAVSWQPGVLWTGLLGLGLSVVFWVSGRFEGVGGVTAAVAIPLIAGASAWLAWWAIPWMPSAKTLDNLTYRVSAFAFPILTFGIIAGAIWAEQSWGRFWGWDPKETSAFLTWVAYASYLHARATRGIKGRQAAYVMFGAYGILLFTYFVVNLLVVGLHSYGGLQ